MAELRLDGWPTDDAERRAVTDLFISALRDEADRAINYDGDPGPGVLSIVRGHAAMGSHFDRAKSTERLQFGADPSRQTRESFLAFVAAINRNKPGIADLQLAKQIWFDGEATALDVRLIQDRKTYNDPVKYSVWLRFMRTFMSDNGTQLVMQILNGGSHITLGQSAQLRLAGYTLHPLDNNTPVAHPQSEWESKLQTRFAPELPLGELSVGAWLELLSAPLNTTHVLRNRGDSRVVKSHRALSWARPEDKGTEEGEMSVGDALDTVTFAIEAADPFGGMPHEREFTLTGAELIVTGPGESKQRVEMAQPPYKPSVKVNGVQTDVDAANNAYGALYSHTVRDRVMPDSWRAAAEKTVRTEQGRVTIIIRTASSINKRSGQQERRAEIVCWRSIGNGYAVEHTLVADMRAPRNLVVRNFDNTRRLYKRDSTRPGGFVLVQELPPALDKLVAAHPDILATFTYDKWYELLKRPLEEADILT